MYMEQPYKHVISFASATKITVPVTLSRTIVLLTNRHDFTIIFCKYKSNWLFKFESYVYLTIIIIFKRVMAFIVLLMRRKSAIFTRK